MSDRFLLELAAKALGVDAVWKETTSSLIGPFRQIQHVPHEGFWVGSKKWNPLEDDGDALRLAVALRLDISPQPDGKVEVSNQWDKPEDLRWAWEAYGDDAHAATRRAIVKAAAEVGATRADPPIQPPSC